MWLSGRNSFFALLTGSLQSYGTLFQMGKEIGSRFAPMAAVLAPGRPRNVGRNTGSRWMVIFISAIFVVAG
jgi:hypothetical protein